MELSETDKKMLQEACLNVLYEVRNKTMLENNMQEYGGSEILYHFTSLPALLSMLLNDGKNGGYFQYGRPDGEEDQIINKKMAGGNKDPYQYYMSLTRSHDANWGYAKAVNDASFGKKDKNGNENKYDTTIDKIPISNIGTVRITFDGRELTKGRVIRAINFYGHGNDPKSGGRTTKTKSGKWAGKTGTDTRYSQIKQQEDRIFSNDFNFPGILNYVTRIDILVTTNDIGIKWASKILTAANGTPVQDKIHVYDNMKYYNRVSADRIGNSLQKRGISSQTWRKEITDKILRNYVFQPDDIIANGDAKLIAVFIWSMLFFDFSKMIQESSFSWRLTSQFTDEQVLRCLRHYLPVKNEKIVKFIEEKVVSQFRNISNEELIDFLFGTKNYKLTSTVGIARTVLGPMKEDILAKFGLSSIKEAIHKIGEIFEKIYKGFDEVIKSKKEKAEKQKAYALSYKNKQATNNNNEYDETQPQIPAQPKKRGRPKLQKPEVPQEPKRRGRKPKLQSVEPQIKGRKGRKPKDFSTEVPEISIKGIGKIFNVKNLADAEAKVRQKFKNTDEFMARWPSIRQKVYRVAKKASGMLNEWTDKMDMMGDNNGWCMIIVGGPGSGKSHFINNYLPIKGEIFDIDAYRKKYLDSIKDTDAEAYGRMSKRGGFKELTLNTVDFLKKAEVDFLKTHSSENTNVIFDIVGRKESDILDIINLTKPFGYNIGICWVVCNRSVAMQRNINRGLDKTSGRLILPDKSFHQRTNGVNRVVPAFLQGPQSSDVDAAWIILTSSSSLSPMTDEEKAECVLELEKAGEGFVISDEDIQKINNVLGPKEKSNNFTPETYLSNAEIKKLSGDRKDFLREQVKSLQITEDDMREMIKECLMRLTKNPVE